ncbi:PfkB family carbohydrate kinase [Oerskovia enterophila]|uniref:Sulfofructose kinase n=1 Tax=Oerskovia enterophila TaxID=43678 RepID=A0A163QSV7_9CELL|nr:PfkB family carbohydrate kinase [Oerskovia enterophila]KZM34491.1 sulfofructose kinase [Oerskovia enterophila]
MLICCGLVTLDLTQVVHALPGPNEKVVALSQSATFGGPAANAAATAAALGVPARLVTAVGSGVLADVVRSEVAAAGVELVEPVSGDRAEGGPPPGGASGPAVSTVLVTAGTGERAVVSTNAANRPTALPDGSLLDRVFGPRPKGRDEAAAACRERDVLLLDGHHPALASAVARRARAAGYVVLLDGGSWKDGTADLLPLCDAVVLSEDFRVPGVPVGRVLDAVAVLGPSFVARSRGAEPLELLDTGARSTVPVPAVHEVVDTLGAGDVLHGAFAAGVALGGPWTRALEEAAVVASRSVTFPGARGWIRQSGASSR